MSEAETLMAVQLQQAQIPFLREVTFSPPRRFRADFLIRGHGLLVEVEGGTWVLGRHVQGKGFAADCEKQYLATLKGYRYLRVTSNQVEDGTALEWIKSLIDEEKAV